MRLNKGDDKTHGVVQVHINDNWGTVCNHKWGQEEIGKVLVPVHRYTVRNQKYKKICSY